MYDTVVRGGMVIGKAGAAIADVGIEGGRVAAVGPGLAGHEVIDAAGKLVLPGAVNPHVHLAMPAGNLRSSDDWASGTIAAACGGTTTVIDFVEPGPAEPMLEALAARRAEAEGQAVIDFGLHMTIRPAEGSDRPGVATLAEVPDVLAAGCPSFKTYLTYEGLRLDDGGLLAAADSVGAAGGLLMVHAENDAGITYLQRKLLADGQTAPRVHPLARPAALEAEAVGQALALAEITGCPLYVVHISTARAARLVADARARGQAAWGETCPQYLLLTADEYDRPGFEGAKFVCSPPLRFSGDNAELWQRLASGDLSTVGTDHCPFFFEGEKSLGRDDFTAIPNGLPGIEARLALMYTYGVGEGRLSLARWVEACCTAPARLFGLYPRKGSLQPGSDADIVIFDPDAELVVGHAFLHEHVDYTPYEGRRLKGYPTVTLRRGQVIYRDGRFVGASGGGQFVPGARS